MPSASLRSSLLFKPDCQYDKPDSSRQYITLEYTNCYGDTCAIVDSVINGIGFFSNAPDLRLETNDSLVIGQSKIFEMDFILRNYVVSTAFNSWVSVTSLSGEASNFQLFKMPQNQEVTVLNGIFNVGSTNGFSQNNFLFSLG